MLESVRHYRHAVGLRGLFSAVRGKAARSPILLEIRRRDLRFPCYLRVPSTDVSAFEQIFIQRQYDFAVRDAPGTIVDAGANVGLAAIHFANRFPAARIIAIEPEDGNFEILQRNVRPYGNIIPLRAALWHQNRRISLVDPALGDWGFMTQATDGDEADYGRMVHEVEGMTMDRIMAEQGIDHVDILKVDIEGAEREVFADPSAWIGKVDALIVELHERLKSGCNRSFYNGTRGFDQEWWQGENVFVTRNRACLTRCPH
ncbi:MAG: hypothetical protein H6R10_3212 [Rhodocyclaceae bacterium]|nr:hypothetical protein [Rhodocyclaceae bacterium]